MSQITRCPSCATAFKVVADQLRISDGWVRCGQCKEVFDASAHLLASAPPALLPDVSLTDVRSPPAPLARAPAADRAWGTLSTQPPVPVPATGLGAALRSGQQGALRRSESDVLHPFPPVSSLPTVMNVPNSAVPAFLAAGALKAAGEALSPEPGTPFAWRAPLPGGDGVGPVARDVTPMEAVPTSATAALPITVHDVPPPDFAGTAPPCTLASISFGGSAPTVSALDAEAVPHGYELPFAEPPDSDWPADALHPGESSIHSAPASAVDETSFPALDVSRSPAPAARGGDDPLTANLTAEPSIDAFGKESVAEHVAADWLSASLDASQRSEGADSLALVGDDSVAALLRPAKRKIPSTDDGADEDEPLEPEVSFVRAARRQALWRKPAVRWVLTLVALAALISLGLQVAVQERDRIAAMDARARPWLMKLCVPLECEIAPRREIADVVIDSSSFNKARGDSYQLTLTLKSQASVPLAMPAVELTLTDAQDQPVLRRVLLPTDMAAPTELPAGGEWNASVAVIVTTGGARVAGYRLLAFYP